MDKQEKDYIFRVYRTVQQSVLVAVTSDREVDNDTNPRYNRELARLANEAEWEAGKLPDGDWKIEEVDTMYALFETMEE